MAEDLVNRPRHYTVYGAECIELVRYLSYPQGCAIGYIWRFPFKGSPRQDLEKALWYIRDMETSRLAFYGSQAFVGTAIWRSMESRVLGMHAKQREAIDLIVRHHWAAARREVEAILADYEPILEDQLAYAQTVPRS